MRYVVEHLDRRLYAWCLLEYKHISQEVGKDSFWITNLRSAKEQRMISPYGRAFAASASELDLGRACVLDPAAKKALSPSDARKFDTIVIGGILGDHPMQGRTEELLSRRVKGERRHLGPEQMSTDTAAIVAKLVLSGKPLSSMRFIDGIEIPIKPGESVELPFRYLISEGKPLLPNGLVALLKRRGQF
jgi:ribosome biogenesis SPOUT family RNA methylase Rps3